MKSMMKMTRNKLSGAAWKGLFVLPFVMALTGCTRDHEFQPVDMWNRTRLKPYEGVGVQDVSTARAMPAGVIARGQLQDNDALYTGKQNGLLVTSFPIPLTEATLKRGQERYTIYCAPCHGGMGDGKGVIVSRGFSPPPDYYEDKRVLNAPIGHYYDVITNGYGAMYSYAARVPVKDRWAIVAYIRLLQRTRAQGGNQGPTLRGGGVYEHLDPTKTEGHEGAHERVEGGEGSESVDPAAKGAAPHSHIPSEESHGSQRGDGANQGDNPPPPTP